MSLFDNLKDEALDAAKANADTLGGLAAQAAAQIADVVDEKTGGRFHEQIDAVAGQADDQVKNLLD